MKCNTPYMISLNQNNQTICYRRSKQESDYKEENEIDFMANPYYLSHRISFSSHSIRISFGLILFDSAIHQTPVSVLIRWKNRREGITYSVVISFPSLNTRTDFRIKSLRCGHDVSTWYPVNQIWRTSEINGIGETKEKKGTPKRMLHILSYPIRIVSHPLAPKIHKSRSSSSSVCLLALLANRNDRRYFCFPLEWIF